MSAQLTNRMARPVTYTILVALFLSLLLTGLVLGVPSQAQAAIPLDIPRFDSVGGLFPGEYTLSGYVDDDDPTGVIITFSGAAGGTVSADSIGYFELRVFGSLGQVTATATNGMETVRRATTLH